MIGLYKGWKRSSCYTAADGVVGKSKGILKSNEPANVFDYCSVTLGLGAGANAEIILWDGHIVTDNSLQT